MNARARDENVVMSALSCQIPFKKVKP